jgi:hypothetical protein
MLWRTKTVYVFGAGASHFAGYPLGKDFWPFVKRFAEKSKIVGAAGPRSGPLPVDDINRVNAVIDNTDNLELLFSLLELTHMAPGSAGGILPPLSGAWDTLNKGYTGWPNPWDNFRQELTGLITQALLYYQHNLNNFLFPDDPLCREAEAELKKAGSPLPPLPPEISSLARPDVKDAAEAYAKRLKGYDHIISFNWDLLHETILYRGRKWRWSDGYGFVANNATKPLHSTVTLYKLHGSVNWSQRTPDTPIEVTDPEQLFARVPSGRPGALNLDPDRGRKNIIIPSLLKTPGGHSLLLDLWFKAGDALRCAQEVVAAGYSFAGGADTVAYYLFVSSLARNRHKPTVIVIDPGIESITTWQRLCDEAGLHEPQHEKCRFEDWLLR